MAFVNGDRWLVTAQTAQQRGVDADPLTSSVDLWDATTTRRIGEPITVKGDAGFVEVDPWDGSRLLWSTTVPTGNFMVWDLDPVHWTSTACSIAGRNLMQSEWKEYLGDRPYQLTCPQWPAGP
jgi:hypothetical protein